MNKIVLLTLLFVLTLPLVSGSTDLVINKLYVNWEELSSHKSILIEPNPSYTIIKEMGAVGLKYNDFYYDQQNNAFFFKAKREHICNAYGCFFGNHPFYITPVPQIKINTKNFVLSYDIYFRTKKLNYYGTGAYICLIDDKIKYSDFTRTYGSYKYYPDPNHKMICLGYTIHTSTKGNRVVGHIRNLSNTLSVYGSSLSTGQWYSITLLGYEENGANIIELQIKDTTGNLISSSKTTLHNPFTFTANHIMYYSGSGGYTVGAYADGYIKNIKIESNNKPKTDDSIIKQPYFIEVKGDGTRPITYSEFSHSLIIYNPNSYDLSNHQVKLVITQTDVDNQFIWVKKGSIRLYDSEGNELPYWVEEWDSENKEAIVWTKVPQVPASGTTSLTLKSSLAYNDKSNGEAVFDFFDGFDTYDAGVSNPDGWTYVQLNYNSYGIAVQEDGGRKVLEIKGVASDSNPHNRYIYAMHDVVVNTKSLVEFCHKENDDDSNFRVKLFVDGSEVLSMGGTTNDYIISSVIVDRASNIQVGHYFSNLWSGTIISYIDWFRVRKYADEEPVVTFVS